MSDAIVGALAHLEGALALALPADEYARLVSARPDATASIRLRWLLDAMLMQRMRGRRWTDAVLDAAKAAEEALHPLVKVASGFGPCVDCGARATHYDPSGDARCEAHPLPLDGARWNVADAPHKPAAKWSAHVSLPPRCRVPGCDGTLYEGLLVAECSRGADCGPVVLEPDGVVVCVLKWNECINVEHGWRAYGLGVEREHPTRDGAVSAWREAAASFDAAALGALADKADATSFAELAAVRCGLPGRPGFFATRARGLRRLAKRKALNEELARILSAGSAHTAVAVAAGVATAVSKYAASAASRYAPVSDLDAMEERMARISVWEE